MRVLLSEAGEWPAGGRKRGGARGAREAGEAAELLVFWSKY